MSRRERVRPYTPNDRLKETYRTLIARKKRNRDRGMNTE